MSLLRTTVAQCPRLVPSAVDANQRFARNLSLAFVSFFCTLTQGKGYRHGVGVASREHRQWEIGWLVRTLLHAE